MKQSDERVAFLGQKCEGPTNSFGVFFFTDKLTLMFSSHGSSLEIIT